MTKIQKTKDTWKIIHIYSQIQLRPPFQQVYHPPFLKQGIDDEGMFAVSQMSWF